MRQNSGIFIPKFETIQNPLDHRRVLDSGDEPDGAVASLPTCHKVLPPFLDMLAAQGRSLPGYVRREFPVRNYLVR
jgi:hypothetical protein